MNNMPKLKIGVVAVSRDCFPESLSVNRRAALMKAYTEKYGDDTIMCAVRSTEETKIVMEKIRKIVL